MTDDELMDAAIAYCQMRGSNDHSKYISVFARLWRHHAALDSCRKRGVDPLDFLDVFTGDRIAYGGAYLSVREDAMALGRKMILERFKK